MNIGRVWSISTAILPGAKPVMMGLSGDGTAEIGWFNYAGGGGFFTEVWEECMCLCHGAFNAR